MPRPKTKIELLEASASNFEKLLALVDSMPENLVSKPGACEEASAKDMLAHLHAWHKLYLNWYEEGMAGEKPEMPAPGFTWKMTPELNAEIDAEYKDVPLNEILSLLKSTHAQLMKIIEGHSDEELFTKKRYAWTGSTSLGSYTVSATSSHYAWALKHIRKFIKQQE